MKKMKPKSTQPCSYCTARADWKSNGLSLVKFACQDHVYRLVKHEKDTRDNGHMTEADHQTWGRLV